MKQILIEVKESLLNKKIFTILISLQIFFLLLLMSALFLNFSNVQTKTESFYAQYEEKNIYQLSDNLIEEREQKYFSDIRELEVLKRFHEELQESEDFVYFNTTIQPIGFLNFKGMSSFLYGYEDGAIPPEYQKEMGTYQVVKSIQVNEQVFSSFNVKIKNGKRFNNNDFEYENKKTIPVILGSNYEGIYEIGDTINIDYIDTPMKAIVIGTLDANTIIPVREQIDFSLDKYIILPEFTMNQAAETKEDLLLQQRHYLHLINGQILTEKDNIEVRKSLQTVSKETGFYDFIVIGANGLAIDLMFSMMKQSETLIITLTILLFCFCIFSIALSLIAKWDANLIKYAVHLISGATINKIFMYTLVEISTIILFMLLLVFIIMTFVGVMPFQYYLIIILISMLIAMIALVPYYIRLKRLNISEMLKRRD